jgi:hypothetical protein
MARFSHALGALCVVTLVTSSASAADRPVAFDHLAQRVQPGDSISVADATGATVSGTVVAVTPASVTLTVNGTRHECLEAAVARIDRHHRFVKRGALVGMIGGIVFAVAGEVACGITCAEGNEFAALGFFGGIGAGVGAAIGAAFHGSDVVYLSGRAHPAPITFQTSRQRIAVKAAFTF